MSDQTQVQAPNKQLAVSNYDKIRALAHNQQTIQRFVDMLGSKTAALAYISSAMLAVANSRDLMECTPSSVFNAVMRAAALRLYCDPALRQAYPVPFNNKVKGKNGQPDRWEKQATLIIGYIGLNNLALRTGKYRYLNADALYEGQILEQNQLTGATSIKGLPTSNKVLGYFHYLQLNSGYYHVFYMDVAALHAHGDRYAPKNPLWHSAFPDMSKKTVTRMNLLKFGILDPADREIIEQMDEDRPEGELMPSETIEGSFSEMDDEQAEADAKAEAERKANEPKRDPQEIINELTGEGKKNVDPATGEIKPPVSAPVIPDNSNAPALLPLRLQPNQLKEAIEKRAKDFAGQKANGKRGVVIGTLEAILSEKGDALFNRRQLLKFLTGKSSSKEITDEMILAIYAWLNPKPDEGGEFHPDPMSAREAIAAFLAAQPVQDGLF